MIEIDPRNSNRLLLNLLEVWAASVLSEVHSHRAFGDAAGLSEAALHLRPYGQIPPYRLCHPLVERGLPAGAFVSNDLELDPE